MYNLVWLESKLIKSTEKQGRNSAGDTNRSMGGTGTVLAVLLPPKPPPLAQAMTGCITSVVNPSAAMGTTFVRSDDNPATRERRDRDNHLEENHRPLALCCCFCWEIELCVVAVFLSLTTPAAGSLLLRFQNCHGRDLLLRSVDIVVELVCCWLVVSCNGKLSSSCSRKEEDSVPTTQAESPLVFELVVLLVPVEIIRAPCPHSE